MCDFQINFLIYGPIIFLFKKKSQEMKENVQNGVFLAFL